MFPSKYLDWKYLDLFWSWRTWWPDETPSLQLSEMWCICICTDFPFMPYIDGIPGNVERELSTQGHEQTRMFTSPRLVMTLAALLLHLLCTQWWRSNASTPTIGYFLFFSFNHCLNYPGLLQMLLRSLTTSEEPLLGLFSSFNLSSGFANPLLNLLPLSCLSLCRHRAAWVCFFSSFQTKDISPLLCSFASYPVVLEQFWDVNYFF